MAFTNLATKLLLNDMQVNSGLLGNGFPFIKFAWEVELQVGTDESKGLSSTGPLIAKTCELPRFSIDSQIVNVYNHKTIVQTKLNYEPITMTFYDQTNGTAESLIWSYIKKQFDSTDGSRKAGVLEDMPLTVTITLKNLSGEGNDKVYVLKNAYIVDGQHDTLDYSTSDPILWTLTLRYEDLETPEFNEATPGDGGAGIAALPKPPSKPVVGQLPNPPVTQPPKADAKKEVEFDGMTVWQAEGLPSTADEIYGTSSAGDTAPAPTKTTPWPQSNANPANNVSFDSNAQDPEAQTFVKPYNSSTGTANTKVQSPATAQQAADARAAYARTDPRRIDNNDGLNQSYKEAYASNYAKEVARIPSNASPQTRARLENKAAQVADLKARVAGPKYTAQVRTQNADGSFTDRAVIQPQSVNNPSTASSQRAKEQQYVNRTNKEVDY